MKFNLFVFITAVILSTPLIAKDTGMNRLIITETKKYKSLDPLDADNTANLPVARMIYWFVKNICGLVQELQVFQVYDIT